MIRNRDFSLDREQPLVCSIAGSDNSAGAGIQADNKVYDRFGVLAANVVTAVTAQSEEGVKALDVVDADLLESQFRSVCSEKMPDVFKLGMLGNERVVDKLTQLLSEFSGQLVCDPVLFASAGGGLLDDPSAYLCLLDHVQVFTPNLKEFETIFSVNIDSPEQLEQEAKKLAAHYQIDLIVTGGDTCWASSAASDLCLVQGETFWMHSPRQETKAVHGTGCSFASAVASSLALGYSVYEAVVLAKMYLNAGLAEASSDRHFIHTRFPDDLSFMPVISKSYAYKRTAFSRTDSNVLGLYPVVDSYEWLEKCLEAGVKTLQLRIKNVAPEALNDLIKRSVTLGKQYGARLFINDYWQIAVEHQAYGVHLGQEDLDDADVETIAAAGLKLGVSTHSWYELARAVSLDPSYIAIGPIYPTETKEMPFAPQGLVQLKQWVAMLKGRYPLVAIGGITEDNAEEVLTQGVGSIAMVRAITDSEDYQSVIDRFNNIIEQACPLIKQEQKREGREKIEGIAV